MKTEMNPDLEFLRGLRERMRLQESICDEISCNTESETESYMLSRKSSCVNDIRTEISEYLKTRGIE